MDDFWEPFKGAVDTVMEVPGRDVITEMDQRLSTLLYKADVSASCTMFQP